MSGYKGRKLHMKTLLTAIHILKEAMKPLNVNEITAKMIKAYFR